MKKKIVGFPPSVQEFLVILHVPLNARVSCYLALTFHNLSPICIFSIDFQIKKVTICEILSLNNRRLVRLQVHTYYIHKIKIFSDQSL